MFFTTEIMLKQCFTLKTKKILAIDTVLMDENRQQNREKQRSKHRQAWKRNNKELINEKKMFVAIDFILLRGERKE